MKIIRIAQGKIKRESAYIVKYKIIGGPGAGTYTSNPIQHETVQSPKDAERYIRITKGKDATLKILETIEVPDRSVEEPTPKAPVTPKAPRKPRAPVTRKNKPTRRITVTPNRDYVVPPSTGYSINYDKDWTKPGKNPEVAYFPEASSPQEALALFDEQIKSEYPSAEMIGNPKRMDVDVGPMEHDETGRRLDQSKTEFRQDLSWQNLPAGEARKRILEREREKQRRRNELV